MFETEIRSGAIGRLPAYLLIIGALQGVTGVISLLSPGHAERGIAVLTLGILWMCIGLEKRANVQGGYRSGTITSSPTTAYIVAALNGVMGVMNLFDVRAERSIPFLVFGFLWVYIAFLRLKRKQRSP